MNLIIIGCGRVGAGLAQALYLQGHRIVMVDKDPAAFERLGTSLKDCTVYGEGTDRATLLQAGIAQADGLAAVTGSDEINLVATRLASQFFQVPRVVARLYEPRKAAVYQRLGVQTITPITWGVNRIAELLTFFTLTTTTSLGDGDVDMVEAEVPPMLAGRTIQDMTIPGEVHVVAISRAGKTFLPMTGTCLQAGDRLHLALLATSINRLKESLTLL